ncbi:MAG: hypothetical protein M0R70_14685 [Nitrospirae bacterium]|nr:hypothetical protein [Nitrospirota bacterium]
MTATEIELSKKLLHTQAALLSLRKTVDKIETVIEAYMISRGPSSGGYKGFD